MPAAMAERGGEDIVLSGSRIQAQRENLGDLKLYRIPIPVSVAARSQKQVVLLDQPQSHFALLYRWPSFFQNQANVPMPTNLVLRMENRTDQGLGLPLPAGNFTLFTERAGRPFLLGEGYMTDRAIGETVEVIMELSPSVTVTQRQLTTKGSEGETELTVTNDQASAIRFEAEFKGDRKPLGSSEQLTQRDGAFRWTPTVPANGSRTLRVRYRLRT